MLDRERVQDALLYRVAAGELDAQDVVRVLAASSPSAGRAADVAAVVRWLEDLGTPEADTLADQLCPEWCGEIRQYLELKAADAAVPVPLIRAVVGLPREDGRRGFAGDSLVEALGLALAAQRDQLALRAKGITGDVDTMLQRKLAEQQARLAECPDLWRNLLPPEALAETLLAAPGRWERAKADRKALDQFAARLVEERRLQAVIVGDWRFRLRGCTTHEQAMACVDELCMSPTRDMAEAIPSAFEEPWQRRRALLVLTWRFGHKELASWAGACKWLSVEAERWRTMRRQLDSLQRDRAAELLLLWSDGQDNVPEPVRAACLGQCAGALARVSTQSLLDGYGSAMSAKDRQKLEAASTPAPTPVVPVAATPVVVALPTAPVVGERLPEPPEPVEPSSPTVWQRHLRPFLTENWLLVAGILGVLAGVSVLVYRYWESTWVVRYGVVQTLLVAGALLAAKVGAWLERRDPELRDTAVVLTGAAFLLVPVNVLCPVMLASDGGTSGRLLAPILGIALLAASGWWLQRVTARMVPGVGSRLSPASTGMHGIALGSLLLMSRLDAAAAPVVLAALPFLLLAVCAWSTWSFAEHTPDEPPEPRLNVFYGVALCGAFLQLVAWEHLLARDAFPGAAWAPFSGKAWALATILAGGLVLLADHRLGQANDRQQAHGRTAFAGFALILLGLLLSLPFPYVRPGAFLLASLVWTAYGATKQHPGHAWIGVSLAALGVIAVAFVPPYPIAWRPAVALLAAVVLEPTVWRWLSGRYQPMEDALTGVQSSFVGSAVVAAVLSQYHYRHAPWIALLVIGLAVCLFAWFAYRDRVEKWVRLAAITAAIALPYAGFADTMGDFATANTMAFGLGVLAWIWIGVGHYGRRVPCLRGPRSTVLVVYGACAMAAMAVRVLVQHLAADAGFVLGWLDTAGPVLVLAALVLAAYWSRSLLPAAMAAVIGAIFAPEMRTFLEQILPQFSWSSGLGSASWGLILIAACFRLRREPRLGNLGDGDRWWGGRPFPWVRLDQTLFTLPIFLTTVFLCLRLNTYVCIRRMLTDFRPQSTFLALALSGIVWLACAAYLHPHRMRPLRICAHLGMFWLGVGMFLLLGNRDLDPQLSILISCLTVQGVHALGLWVAKPRFDWSMEVLVRPARQFLMNATFLFLFVSALVVCWFDVFSCVGLLAAFCVIQLIWHGLRLRSTTYGWFLFPYVLLMVASAELGSGGPLQNLGGLHQVALWPLVVLIAALVLAVAAERWYAMVFSRGTALVTPLLLGSGALAMLCGGLMLERVFDPGGMTMIHFWVAAGFILLAARANGWSVPVLLVATTAGMLLAALGVPRPEAGPMVDAIMQPWKLGLFGCFLLACTHGGLWGFRRCPWLFVSPQAPYPMPSSKPFTALGVLAAGAGLTRHVAIPVYRDAANQVGTPFLSALAFAGAALAPVAELVVPLFVAAGTAVGLGCVLAVRVFAGPWLRELGAGEVHLVVLGLAVTVVLAEAAALAVRRHWPTKTCRWACAAPAALIPVLLASGYLLSPGLAATNSVRCLISGLCLLVAAAPFRSFREMEEEIPLGLGVPISLALAVASWSMAVPWFRQPNWALSVLLLPAVLLLILAGLRERQPPAWCNLNPDLVFCVACAPLLLHLAPFLYRLLCFPEPVRWLSHFHTHALVPLVAGIVMARLAARHGHRLAAYLAGPLLATGVYAVVAQWPLAWCFDPVFLPATVWMLVVAHVWLGLIGSATVRQWLVGDTHAEEIGAPWRGFACVASQVVVLGVILNGALHSYASAPLLAGAASVLVHAAAARGPHWLGGVALVELGVSVHMDFLTPSYLPRDMVIWVLLGVWATLLLADRLLRERLREQASAGSQALALLVFAQICYVGPGSVAGLVAMALGAGLYALAPLRSPIDHVPDATPAPLLLLVPAWLAFWWSLGPAPDATPPTMTHASLAAACGLLIMAPLTTWQGKIIGFWQGWRPTATRCGDTAILWLHERAETADMGVLIVVAAITLVGGVRTNIGTGHAVLCIALCAALVWGWWRTGERLRDTSCVVVALAAFFLALYTLRGQLLVADLWRPEWDIWAGLALSSLACALEQVFSRQPDYARGPLVALFWAVPIANVTWLLSHQIWGTDMPLFLTAVHSLQFGYLGRHEKASPFRAAAVVGAVAFCLIAFGTRLRLRHAYAYVVPIGFGVLALVRLFGERMEPKDRNTVRALALLSMLGSTAYYVIADSNLSLVHIAVLGLLCLFCMGVAAFTRIRAYLYLGFTGFVVDLGALLYRVLIRLERGAVMTLVGVLVLVGGLGLVTGSIYYKLHREELIAKLRALGAKLGTWE